MPLHEHRQLLGNRRQRSRRRPPSTFAPLSDQQFWSQTVDGVTLGAIYALIALGYTLVYGVLRLINFAHSEVFMVGVFGSLFAAPRNRHSKRRTHPWQASAWQGCSLVMVVGGMLVSRRAGRRCSNGSRIGPCANGVRPASRSSSRAIGASLFMQELVRPALRRATRSRSLGLSKRDTVFTFFGADVQVRQAARRSSRRVVLMVALERFVNDTQARPRHPRHRPRRRDRATHGRRHQLASSW